MVYEGQVFKNYLELCKCLGEQEKHGASRKAQLRRWECFFSWHKAGQKIIIDEVYEDGEYHELRGGNNDTPHVDVMVPYVRSRILTVDFDEYIGTQRLLGSVLRLVPMSAYKQINARGMKAEDFYRKYQLDEPGSFEEYVSVAGIVMKETVVKCLKRMQKNKEIHFVEAEVFIAKDGRRRYLCVDGYDELVRTVEYNVCNEIAAELGMKTKGRQLIHYICGRPELMQKYYRRCMEELLKNPALVKDLKNQYLIVGPGRELKLENVSEYYKVVHIIDYDEDRIEKARGPDYDEKKQLKAIYEDIKPRIAARVASSKKDVATIEKMLFG
jgi:hypothetical protein